MKNISGRESVMSIKSTGSSHTLEEQEASTSLPHTRLLLDLIHCASEAPERRSECRYLHKGAKDKAIESETGQIWIC